MTANILAKESIGGRWGALLASFFNQAIDPGFNVLGAPSNQAAAQINRGREHAAFNSVVNGGML